MEAKRKTKSGGKSGIFVILAVLAVVFVPVKVGYCQTIIVRADGSGDYPTIQAAIEAAVAGDEVVLAQGIYTGDGNRDIDFLGKAITVRSTDPDNNDIVAATIIDCNGTQKEPHRGFVFQNGEGPDSIIDGITITSGYLTGSHYPSWAGSAILCDRSSPTISKCIVKENECVNGVIYCTKGNPTLEGCTIRSNRASEIVCLKSGGSLDVIDCVIIENNGRGISAQGDLTVANSVIALNNGGGVKSLSRSLTVTNSTIRDNDDTGIFVFNNDATIKNCVIERNVTSSVGGAIYCVYTNSINIENSWIVNNVAREAGAIFLGSSDCRIDNCVIAGNNAELWGGGIYCSDCTATITNSTISGNSGGEKGGGIGCQYGCDITVLNCILWNNSSILGKEVNLHVRSTPSKMTIGYSNIRGGIADVFVGGSILEWGAGNIDTSPQFVDPLSRDYHLRSSSPCIDAGDPNYVAGPNETDLDGNPRVFGDRIDMGAYEFTVTNVPPVACIVGGDRGVEAGKDCEGRVVLDGSCSSDADSTAGTNDDINDFDWYEVIDACEPNSDIYIGSGEVIECNLGLGEHLIILEVTDKAGAFDTNEVVITVEDTTPPEFSLWVEPNVLWPPNHTMVLITPGWEVSDNCDESPEVSLVSITSSEADDATGDGHTGGDVEIGDDGSISLRAERSGSGTGRVYTITYEAVDDSGNAAIDSADVVVPHDLGRRWRQRQRR